MNPSQRLGFSLFGLARYVSMALVCLLPVMATAQVSVSISGTNPSCNGYTNGAATATATGGASPYNFTWSNGANGSTVQGLSAGSISVTATDANGATATASFNLSQPNAVSVSITVNNPCAGGGNATATATGGTGAFTYQWDNGATGATVSGLSAGLHCVTATDANGCAAVTCKAIPGAMNLNLFIQGLACFNFCDASIEALVTGGTAPYTYVWSNGAIGSVNPNLGPGIYSVTVTDANGCTKTGTSDITNPAQLSLNLTTVNPSCGSGGSATGSATVAPTGGTAPYQVQWSTGATGNTIAGLVPGSYSVTVTDFLGCQGTASVSIVAQSNLTINATATASSACGTPTGTATAAPVGGVAPYTYAWNNGQNTATISGLVPGNYSVVVTDAQGCGANANVTVGGTPAIDLNIVGVNAGCVSNGSAAAMVTPGTGTAPFTYLWSNGATTSVINNISAGNYSVTVTDANGCTSSRSVIVTGSSAITATATATPVSCFAGNNGSATVTAAGATAPFTYQWNNGGNTATINNLTAATYFVTVTHTASGCTAITSVQVTQPTQVGVTVTGVNGACNTLGSATAVATGGTPGYTYAWSNGATGASISNLNSGAYAVTATDTRGCAAMGMISISNSNPSLNVTVTVTNPISGVNEDDGAVSTTVSGGTAPYTYAWNTGATTSTLSNLGPGTYTVTVTSSNGCTGTGTVTLVEPSCIGDRVWNDVNRNGCQDPGEFGVGNVTVQLTGTTTGGAAVALTTTTALNGQYQFNNLQPGTYQVKFTAPVGYTFSPANNCTDDFTDSDALASGSTATINLAAGNCNVTVDAGIHDVCVNVPNAGTICCDQVLCGPGVDADIITGSAVTGGGSATQYMWMYNSQDTPYDPNVWTPVPGATGQNYDPGVIYSNTYFVRCVKAQNCSDWLETTRVAITIGNTAVAEITGPDLTCVGDSEQYFATSNGAGATYSWNFGPWATPSTSTAQNPTVTWNQAGVVNITLAVTKNGCVSTDVLPTAISNSPIICGNGIIINVGEIGNAVMVDWQLERMDGNYEFEVQRSNDGVTYEKLAVIAQNEGDGSHQYTFADYFPKKGNAFYRVEMVKEGEHTMYSNTKLVQRFANAQNFLVRPSLVADNMTIEANSNVETATMIEIYTMQGRMVQAINLDAGSFSKTISLGHLPAGNYLMRMNYNNGQREVIRFTKG
jgi:hypothetical protein